MRVLFCLLVLLPSAALAGACLSRSPAHTLALVELYTSHACTTCPPADQWFQTLEAQGFGLDRVIPMSLHVDARDYGGGSPSGAREAHISRQRRMTRLARAALDYSPRVLVQGQAFTGWGTPRFGEAVDRIHAQAARADLEIRLDDGHRVRLEAALRPGAAVRDPVVYLATYAKKVLKESKDPLNERIILAWEGPYSLGVVERGLPPWPEAGAAQTGVVAFVQDRATGEVLQALMRPACPDS